MLGAVYLPTLRESGQANTSVSSLMDCGRLFRLERGSARRFSLDLEGAWP